MAGELSPENRALVERVAPSRAEQSIARLYPELLNRLLDAARADRPTPEGGEVSGLGQLLFECWQRASAPAFALDEAQKVQWSDYDAEQQVMWELAARAFSEALGASREGRNSASRGLADDLTGGGAAA